MLRDDAVAAFQDWLRQHAGQLLSLRLQSDAPCSVRLDPLRLPLHKLTQLQQLELAFFESHLTDQESSSSDSAARTVVLPSLQHMKLDCVDFDSTRSLLQCTQAPHITSLVLRAVNIAVPEEPCSLSAIERGVQQVVDVLPGVLQQLPWLSVLELPDTPLKDTAMQQLAAMQGLRQLTLPLVVGASTFDLQHLPSSLTQLSLKGPLSEPGAASLLQLPQQLSGLLSLDLEWCDVLPAVLGSVTKLQRLRLERCTLLTYVPEAMYDTEGTAALLDILPKLKRLQQLDLQEAKLDTVSIAPQRFSALTASSHLTRLALAVKHQRPIPQAAVQHMFPAGRPSPQLWELVINPQHSDLPDGWFLDSAELGALISACPGLQGLNISRAVKPGAELSALLQLPSSCTQLSVGGEAFGDAAVPMIAKLTQLKTLSWCRKNLTAAGAQQLEAIGVDRLHWGF